MDEEYQIGRIEAYFSGGMSPAEKLDFEQSLVTDTALNRLYHEHRYFLDGIVGMKMESFAEKLKNENTTPGLKSAERNRKLNSYISIAAGIIILIGISFLIMRPQGLSQLAKVYYEVPFARIERSNTVAEDSLITFGMEAFAKKQWQEAISIFNQVPVSNPSHDAIIYYMAHAFVGKGEYEKALALFNNPALTQEQFAEQATWNGILMKMYLNKPKEEIIADLRKISSDGQNFYYAKADELLKQIEK